MCLAASGGSRWRCRILLSEPTIEDERTKRHHRGQASKKEKVDRPATEDPGAKGGEYVQNPQEAMSPADVKHRFWPIREMLEGHGDAEEHEKRSPLGIADPP